MRRSFLNGIKIKMMNRDWYDIPYYENLYQINKEGTVKSLDRVNVRGYNIKGKVLSPNIHYKSGYKSVQLCKDGKTKRFNVHSLMIITFIDKDYLSKGLVCNHIDGVKSNNELSNLECVTVSENMLHSYKYNLNTPAPQIGEKHGKSKLTEKDVIQIRNLYNSKKYTQKELAAKFEVARVTISDITRGKLWKHLL
jgi:DNA-binding XRE family transcriptional regulator